MSLRTLLLSVAAAAITVAAAASAAIITWDSTGKTAAAAIVPASCVRLVVPAYFDPSSWAAVAHSKPPPADVILDITGVGAGTAPQPEFQAAVREVRAAGVTVLGYISTVDGQRPLAQDEQDVRDYAAWYGVTSVFLDRVSGEPDQLGYYRQLTSYIRAADKGGQIWLNPGIYPDGSYMSLADVVMVFEGTYAEYKQTVVPGWARDYPATRFAHTIYDTGAGELTSALRLAARRDADHVYVTDGSGSDPYDSLPGYWSAEDAAIAATCRPAPAR